MSKQFEKIIEDRISSIPKSTHIFLFPQNQVSEKIFIHCKNSGYNVEYFTENNVDVCEVIVICEDKDKVACLNTLSKFDWKNRRIQVILGGRRHHDIAQLEARAIEAKYNLTSHAVGYSHTKAHILESITHLTNQNKTGWVVELGTFRGGTLGLIEKIFDEKNYRDKIDIAGFDTWGEQAQHAFRDIFYMPDWVSKIEDYQLARNTVTSAVSLIKGDISESFVAWSKNINKQIIFAFIDTDNFTAVSVSLPVLWEKLAVGGIIIFDHFYTYEDFYDTVGEHVAAVNFFKDRTDYFHLSETGVFMKI